MGLILPFPTHQYSPKKRKYLSDPTEDVRVATETLLADFLREIREVTIVNQQTEEQVKAKRDSEVADSLRRSHTQENLPDLTLDHSERAAFISENGSQTNFDDESALKDDDASDPGYRDTGGRISFHCTVRVLANLERSLDPRTGSEN